MRRFSRTICARVVPRVGSSCVVAASAAPQCLAATRAWSQVTPPSATARQYEADRVAADESGVATLIKCIDKEVDDEKLRIDKEAPAMPEDWDVVHHEGTAVFTMTRVWKNGEKHSIRCVLPTRDPSLDPECDIRGEHFKFGLQVEQSNNKTLDFAMDVIEGECVVDNIRVFESSALAQDDTVHGAFDRSCMYPGPNLDETEEEVLDGLQAFLSERSVDDQLAEFVSQYAVWIEQLEYERWLQELRAFVVA
jgi:hypothetical protein